MSYNRTWVTLTFIDGRNRTKTKTVEMVTNDAATAETAGDAVYAAYAAVTQGAISKFVVSGEKLPVASPGATSNVDAGVTVSCALLGGGKAANKWPMPTEAIINADGSLDLADLDVVAVQTLYEAGETAHLSHGQSITSFLSGQLDK